MNSRQREIVVLTANWLNRAIERTPLAVVPRWRLQELQHDEVRDSSGRDHNWRLGLIVSLVLHLLPYRYRLLAEGMRVLRTRLTRSRVTTR